MIGEIFVKIYKFTLKFFTHSYIKKKKRFKKKKQNGFDKGYKLSYNENGNSSRSEKVQNKTENIAKNIEYSELSPCESGNKGNQNYDIYHKKQNIFQHNKNTVMRNNYSESSE